MKFVPCIIGYLCYYWYKLCNPIVKDSQMSIFSYTFMFHCIVIYGVYMDE